jgi:hypothetical protein
MFYFLLDELFFPSYRKVTLNQPVFIVGIPRSATTLMLQTLSADTERFSSMKLWEIVLAPTICQKKIFLLIYQIDKFLNSPIRRIAGRLDKLLFRKFEHFHPLSLFTLEEDEYLFYHIFSSPMLILMFPGVRWFNALLDFDCNIGRTRKNRIIAYYKNCIRKHLFVHGEHKQYLAKNPAHLLKINTLRLAFPDAFFIYMLRIPHQSVPSCASLFTNLARIHQNTRDSGTITNRSLAIIDQMFRTVGRIEPEYISPNEAVIKYEEFIPGIENTIVILYGQFKFKLSDSLMARIKSLAEKNKSFASKHKYSLSDFNLSVEGIRHDYAFIYTKFYPNDR